MKSMKRQGTGLEKILAVVNVDKDLVSQTRFLKILHIDPGKITKTNKQTNEVDDKKGYPNGQ